MTTFPSLSPVEIRSLGEFLQGRRVAVLTGAGCSTASGIPDYRGPESRKKKRNPIQYKEFVSHESFRKRYWGRSAMGWPRFSQMLPNAAHLALAEMEEQGIVEGIITQNVDRLHHKAGSQSIIELHGALAEVCCLQCRETEDRNAFQERLLHLNPGWEQQPAEMAPDGDAEVASSRTASFQVPACRHCEGMLKPNVVLFGENVPKPIVDEAWSLLERSDALFVVGSSLTVYSGYRFVRKAEEWGMPIAILNHGETRGDAHATLRLDGNVSEVLPRVLQTF